MSQLVTLFMTPTLYVYMEQVAAHARGLYRRIVPAKKAQAVST